MQNIVNAQDWLDTVQYPFKSNFIDLGSGKMHYLDEGEGEVILFVHGTPTWSFLYRNFIKAFSNGYRCIAPDHIGFGLSDKPGDYMGTPKQHAENLAEFIEKLNLDNITLVVHDFGGPIGLGCARQHADKIKQVVLFNSWLWATEMNPEARKVDKIINSAMGKFLYLRMNFSPQVLLKKGFHDKKNLPKKVHKHYIKPFPNRTSRLSLWNIGKSLVGSSDWYQEQWIGLSALKEKPWLILWGVNDPFFNREYLNKWRDSLPDAVVKEFDCGHFVQEEATEASIAAIDDFIR
ncbi:alpha/beta fold hydrolase [Fulvivirga sp. M361]|uniref:alpha/beta fold hydrolase n=1 Tax=Fulvivirga sp. M361 TaxID=2594266 RepID=UPI00117B3046|nr:alpha/beta fold hydrolase [Fulvivirga sp. M361]TRX62729.1 alpha/beta fold hydrolase [Fulvivirga sp. M361]